MPGRAVLYLFSFTIVLTAANAKSIVRAITARNRILFVGFSLFIVLYAALIIMIDRANGINDVIYNLELIFPFLLFFVGIYGIQSKIQLRKYMKVLVFFVLAGSLVSVVQGLHGNTPLFDSEYYALGHWQVQAQDSIGMFVRTMLPIIYFISAAFIMLAILFSFKRGASQLVILAILLSAIIIASARSLWISLIITLFIFLFVKRKQSETASRKRTTKKKIVLIIVLTVLIASVVYLDLFDISKNVATPFVQRFASAFVDIMKQGGTLGMRLTTIGFSIAVWLKSPIVGLGPHHMWKTGWFQLSDIGITYLLVTIGALGFCGYMVWLYTMCRFGFETFVEGITNSNDTHKAFGLGLLVVPIFFFIFQQTTNISYSLASMSVLSFLCVKVSEFEVEENVPRIPADKLLS